MKIEIFLGISVDVAPWTPKAIDNNLLFSSLTGNDLTVQAIEKRNITYCFMKSEAPPLFKIVKHEEICNFTSFRHAQLVLAWSESF